MLNGSPTPLPTEPNAHQWAGDKLTTSYLLLFFRVTVMRLSPFFDGPTVLSIYTFQCVLIKMKGSLLQIWGEICREQKRNGDPSAADSSFSIYTSTTCALIQRTERKYARKQVSDHELELRFQNPPQNRAVCTRIRWGVFRAKLNQSVGKMSAPTRWAVKQEQMRFRCFLGWWVT